MSESKGRQHGHYGKFAVMPFNRNNRETDYTGGGLFREAVIFEPAVFRSAKLPLEKIQLKYITYHSAVMEEIHESLSV